MKNRKMIILVIIIAVLISIFIYQNINRQIDEDGRTLVTVSAVKFKELVDSRSINDTILDVRTADEYAQTHIEGARLFDFYDYSFTDTLSALDKDSTYYIYCKSGARATRAMKIMENLGFKSIYNLKGGIEAWAHKKYPIISGDLNKPLTLNIPLPTWASQESFSSTKKSEVFDYTMFKDQQETKAFYNNYMPKEWAAKSDWQVVGDKIERTYDNGFESIKISIEVNKLCISKTTLKIHSTKK